MSTTLTTLGPVATPALLASLLTLAWCIRVVRKTYNRRIRKLAALIGFVALYQGFRILLGKGLVGIPAVSNVAEVGDAIMILICVLSLVLIQHHNVEDKCTHMRLRLAEANGTKPVSGASLPDSIVR